MIDNATVITLHRPPRGETQPARPPQQVPAKATSPTRYPAYKPSGQPWLGEVPVHWELKRLKHVVEVNPTKSNSSFKHDDEIEVTFIPMELVGVQGEVDTTRTKQIADVFTGFTYAGEDDVILAKITPCFENGKAAVLSGLTNGVAFASTEFHVLRATANTVSKYLYYLVFAHSFRVPNEAFMQGAAGQKRVGTREVEEYNFALPPLPEQIAIARYLDAKTAQIDELIAAKERLVQLLTEQRTALIHRAVTRGLDPDAKLKDSGVEWLGEVPEGWEVVPLKRALASIEQGWSPQCESRRSELGEWGVLKAGAVNYGSLRVEENKFIAEVPKNKLRYKINKGDVLISRANTTALVGSAVLIDKEYDNLILCDKLYRIVPDHTKVESRYLVNWLQSSTARLQIEEAASGASDSMQNISQDKLVNIFIQLPPLQIQSQILDFMMSTNKIYRKSIKLYKFQIASLRALRTALISEVVTGKRDVRHHPLGQPVACEQSSSNGPL